MNQQVTDYNGLTCTGLELSEWLGLTDMRVSQLCNTDKVLSRDERNRYPLKQSVASYCDYLRGSTRGSDAAKREQQERTRLTSVKADLEELKHAELQGELLRAEAVQKQGAMLGTILRNNLESIPDRIAAVIAAETDPLAVHEIINNEVRNSLADIVAAMEHTEVDDARLDITRRTALEQLSESENQDD